MKWPSVAHRLVGRDADFTTLVREGSVDQLINCTG